MQVEEMIQYIERKIAKSGLSLSEEGIEGIKKRFKQKESQGGFSAYWKETPLAEIQTETRSPKEIWEEAEDKINLNLNNNP